MGVSSLPTTVTRQRSDCDLNPGPSAPESSTLTTRLPSHEGDMINWRKGYHRALFTAHELNCPATSRPSYTGRLLVTRVSVAT